MRVHITGNAGSGKSTFARSIGKTLGIDIYGLDKIVWSDGWRKTPLNERKRLEKELEQCSTAVPAVSQARCLSYFK